MYTTVYANMLFACESGRMTPERLRRLLDCKNIAEAFKMLGDYGYVYTRGDGVDGFIVGETNAFIDFLSEYVPNKKVLNSMLCRFKYNNCKLAYKSRFADVGDGYYHLDLDVSAIKEGDYDGLPGYMQAALTELDTAKESSPQKIDIALTRAMYREALACKVPCIKKYFTVEIDMKNILTAARLRRLGLGSSDEFIDGGKVSADTLTEAIKGDFASCFEHTDYADYAQAIADNDFAELWRAERDADEYLLLLTDSEVRSYTSSKPMLNFYTERLIELKTVKTALVCIKTNSRDMFFNRVALR